MAVNYGFAQPPAYIEEFQRNLLQGAFDATKAPYAGGIPKQGSRFIWYRSYNR